MPRSLGPYASDIARGVVDVAEAVSRVQAGTARGAHDIGSAQQQFETAIVRAMEVIQENAVQEGRAKK